jgi:hypothetical protein
MVETAMSVLLLLLGACVRGVGSAAPEQCKTTAGVGYNGYDLNISGSIKGVS